MFALHLKPPYYAVIFTSHLMPEDAGYGSTADRMVELAAAMPGYLGVESARGADGLGIRFPIGRMRNRFATGRRKPSILRRNGKALSVGTAITNFVWHW